MKKFLKPFAYMAIAVITATSYSCSKDDKTSLEFEHDGHRYLIVKELKTWTDAAKDAVAKGGYLVEIGSQAEQDAVYQGIKNAGISSTYTKVNDGGGIAYVWIGAMAISTQGLRSWIWNGANAGGTFPMFWFGNENGSAVGGNYFNWGGKSAGKTNEPDNFTHPSLAPNGQSVAAIGLASWPEGSSSPLGVAGEWNDIAHTNKLYYIIEFDNK